MAKLEQNKTEKPMSVRMTSVITGFFGGVFWSALGLLAYYFHFTELRPNTVLEPWAVGDWKTKWIGTVISLLVIGVFGIGASLLYYFTLRKLQTIWMGALFGIVLFALVFFILNPLFPSLNPITQLKLNTITTTVCLYILFGIFTGYSISYEYHEQMVQKNQEQKNAEDNPA